VEVLCEAADLGPRLERVARPYGVGVYMSGGFDGLKGKRAIADRAMGRDAPTIVLHVGDRDDHGDDIYMAAAWGCSRVGRGSRLRPPLHLPTTPRSLALLTSTIVRMEKNDSSGPGLIFMRLALTPAQAQEHGLLDADGKAEVDAVPVPVMDAWRPRPSKRSKSRHAETR
jgi:hypothetical protein